MCVKRLGALVPTDDSRDSFPVVVYMAAAHIRLVYGGGAKRGRGWMLSRRAVSIGQPIDHCVGIYWQRQLPKQQSNIEHTPATHSRMYVQARMLLAGSKCGLIYTHQYLLTMVFWGHVLQCKWRIKDVRLVSWQPVRCGCIEWPTPTPTPTALTY